MYDHIWIWCHVTRGIFLAVGWLLQATATTNRYTHSLFSETLQVAAFKK